MLKDYKKERQEYDKKYYRKHRKEKSRYSKRYRQKHREEIRERDRKYYKEHKEKISAYFKKYYQDNKEKPKHKFKEYTRSARRRNYEWKLTFQQFMTFWQKPCYYCGSEIKTIGLDRTDNSKGYLMDNVVSCCEVCNKGKRSMSKNDFINHCKRIVKLQEDTSIP